MTAAVALVTPTYRNDFDRCALLCESIDEHVTGFGRHYLIVSRDDYPLFQRFNRGRRVVVCGADLLPRWLRPAPRFASFNGRKIWWSLSAGVVHGWHVQQILKISAALAFPEQRYCCVDSDNVFFRPFDVGAYGGAERTPLYCAPGAIAADSPMHGAWTRNCDRLLGHEPSIFPADDYIGHEIVWDRDTVEAMTRRIEAATGRSWQAALCRTRAFSEYLLYGHFVRQSRRFMATHALTHLNPALPHWEFTPLSAGALAAMIAQAPPHVVALCVGSFSATPLARVRDALRAAQPAETCSAA